MRWRKAAVLTGAMLSSRLVGNYIHVPLLLLKSIKIKPHLYIGLKWLLWWASDVSEAVDLNLVAEFLTDLVFDISLRRRPSH